MTRSFRRWTFRVLLVVAAALWVIFLRPTSLGGSTSYVVVAGDSMLPTYADGTLVVGFTRTSYEQGDVITFAVDADDAVGRPLVIHRILSGNALDGYTTQGDNGPFTDPWNVMPADILGREAFAIPGVGQALLVLRSPVVIASVSAAVMIYVVLGWTGTGNEGPRDETARRPIRRRAPSCCARARSATARLRAGTRASCAVSCGEVRHHRSRRESAGIQPSMLCRR